MTYRNIDTSRLKFLLAHGLTSDETKRFFEERRKQLILKGDKQDPPRNTADAIQRMSHFTDGAHRVLAEWLSQQPHGESEGLRTYVLNYFRAVEVCKLRLPEKIANDFARAGLIEFYSSSPEPEWLDFLTSEISSQKETSEQFEPTRAIGDLEVLTPEVAAAFGEWALGVGSASSIPESSYSRAALLVEAIRKGDKSLLPTNAIPEASWLELIKAREATGQHRRIERQGLTAVLPEVLPRDPNVDYLSMDVICATTRSATSGPYFLDVLCFCGDDGPFALSGTDIQLAVPDEGRVILHADARLPDPHPGVPEVYRVEQYKTPRSIKVRAKAVGSKKLYRVVYVPHPSIQPDAVRQWMLSNAPSTKNVIYVLADSQCIRPRGELTVTSPSFDWVFDSWCELFGVELAKATYVVSPLPQPHSIYECPPASVTARRLLKNLVERGRAKLTKQQLADLSHLLGSADLPLTDEYRQRLKGNLTTLSSTDTYYDELMAEIMTSPSVQRDIESRKQDRVQQADEELNRKRTQLENLRKETSLQEGKLARLKDQTEERAREMRLAIRKAFDQAREKEAEVLGQLALWQELLMPVKGASSSEGVSEPHTQRSTQPSLKHLVASEEKPRDVLRTSGLDEELASIFAEAIAISVDLGLPIILRGTGSLYIGSRLGAAISRKGACVVDISIGTTDPGVLSSALNGGEHDVVVLRNANVSDMTLYAGELLERIVEIVCRPPITPAEKMILLVEADGPAALSWPNEISEFCLKLDLSRRVLENHVQDERAWLATLHSPMQKKVWSRFEYQAQKRSLGEEALGTLRALLCEG